jgi:hypothetical protein
MVWRGDFERASRALVEFARLTTPVPKGSGLPRLEFYAEPGTPSGQINLP